MITNHVKKVIFYLLDFVAGTKNGGGDSGIFNEFIFVLGQRLFRRGIKNVNPIFLWFFDQINLRLHNHYGQQC